MPDLSMIKEPFILKSLQELLASSADADELQFEVLQILGMQGDAFDITAQILDSKKRPLVAELLKPSSHNARNRRAAARGQNGDGGFALPTSQAEADAMIAAQLAEAQNRPLWTGERKVSGTAENTDYQLTDRNDRLFMRKSSIRTYTNQAMRAARSAMVGDWLCP